LLMNRVIPLLGVLLAGLAGCDNTEPPMEPQQPPAKRDYAWSTDSVDYGSSPGIIELEEIWGSSTTDVWGVAGSAPDELDCLWHYDGTKWSRATAGTPISGSPGANKVYAIWGSTGDDVWTVGRRLLGGVSSAFIMHFDGTHWVDATPPNVSALPSALYSIHGISGNDVWAGGDEHALHYDGSDWSVHRLADSLTIFGMTSVDDDVFFYLSSLWGKPDRFLYQYSPPDSNIRVVDHTTIAEAKFGWRPWIANQVFHSLLNGVTSTGVNDTGVIDTSGWQRVFSVGSYFRGSVVIGPADVFAVGYERMVYHFNGVDWKELSIAIPGHSVDPHSLFWGVWGDGREVFICDVQNGIVYHGR